MVFSSLYFLFGFLPLFFAMYYMFRGRTARNTVLFVFSLVFYAWGEPLYILLMLFSLTANFLLAKLIGRCRTAGRGAPAALAAAVAVNLLLLGVFKYAGFFVSGLNLLPSVTLTVPVIELPIGISFYTFQILSYVIDVYRGKVGVQHNYVFLGAYLAAFPQLIAGPIVRYETVADELSNRRETREDIADGLRRFIIGLGKKVMIANTVAVVVDNLLETSAADYGLIGGWIIALGYTLQIYFDFSGYSDMAIGLGRMIGFHYLENFNFPYVARSVTDFWRRWHISLSAFFRDYVYIPLGGNRVSKPRWIFNMLAVWLLTGLWHGADITFVIWGLYYGILLILERLLWGEKLEKIPVLNRIYTILIVVFGWVIFRADNLATAGEIYRAMLGGYGAGGAEIRLSSLLTRCGVSPVFLVTGVLAGFCACPLAHSLLERLKISRKNGWIYDCGLFAVLLLCVISLASGSYNPFIYFEF